MVDKGFVHFRCDSSGNVNRSDLCLNGGTCASFIEADGFERQFCMCPPEYVHDFVAGHFPNCAMTTATLPVMFGVLLAIAILALGVSGLIFLELKSSLRRVAGLAIATTILCVLMFLSVWVQSGLFEAGLVFWFLRNVVNYRCLIELAYVFTRPMYALLRTKMDRFKRLMTVLEVINFSVQLAIIVSLMVFSRDGFPSRFNSGVTIFFLFFSVMMIAIGATILKQISELKAEIQSNSLMREDAKLITFSKNLVNYQRLCGSLVVMFTLLIGWPVCYIVLGSLPGQYVFFFFFNLSVPVFTYRGAILMQQAKESYSGSSGHPTEITNHIHNNGAEAQSIITPASVIVVQNGMESTTY